MAVIFSIFMWLVASILLLIFIETVLGKHIPGYFKVLIAAVVVFSGMQLSSGNAYNFQEKAFNDVQNDKYLVLERGIEPFTEINPASLYTIPLSRLVILVKPNNSPLILKILDNHKDVKSIIGSVKNIDCRTNSITIMSHESLKTLEFKIPLDEAVCNTQWYHDDVYRSKVQKSIDEKFYTALLQKSLKAGGILLVLIALAALIGYFKKRSKFYRTVMLSLKIKFFIKAKDKYHPSELVAIAWLMVRNIDEDVPELYSQYMARIEETKRILIQLFSKLDKDADEFIFLKPYDLLDYFEEINMDRKIAKIPGYDRYLLTLLFPVADDLHTLVSEYGELADTFFDIEMKYMKTLGFGELIQYNTDVSASDVAPKRFEGV